MKRRPGRPRRGAAERLRGTNKVDVALTSAAQKLELEIKPSGGIPKTTIDAIAQRIGVKPRTIYKWRAAGRLVTKDVIHVFILAELSGLTAKYLASDTP